ncbi:hypothetical protein K432DRAFT_362334 [Lepidopterella palustris CBS 459.81]|uniref:Uncharacterized protein n=1 Tax=Lepidopterella palustris CBS 459.81 TaxID=1314670 RepID=A0A8E2JAG7_9PEZI|nr:hypothetical protein K432DRAFT_362334 [Lepidopterella palustris CBS 459.81]
MASYNTGPLEPNSPLLGPRAKYISPSLRKPVKVDPAASGVIIRYAIAIEVVLNVSIAIFVAVFPKALFSPVVTDPSTITTTTISICQWIGTIIVAFTIQLILVLPNTRGALESRRLVYWTLLAGECCLVPIFLSQSVSSTEGGFSRKFLEITASFFIAHMLWRLFCLFVKPHWFGRYQDYVEE